MRLPVRSRGLWRRKAELYGDEAWESMPEEERCVLDFLCGNHTRGLPVDAFNRRFEAWIEDELGEAFAAAAGESGGQARLEKSGTELLRSIFKLIHSGWGAYEKVGLWVVCGWLFVVCGWLPLPDAPSADFCPTRNNDRIGSDAPRAIRARIPKWAGGATTNRGYEHQAQAPKRSVNYDFFTFACTPKLTSFCSLLFVLCEGRRHRVS